MSLIMRCSVCGQPLRAQMTTPVEIKKVGTCACRKCSEHGGESIRDWYISGKTSESAFDETYNSSNNERPRCCLDCKNKDVCSPTRRCFQGDQIGTLPTWEPPEDEGALQ